MLNTLSILYRWIKGTWEFFPLFLIILLFRILFPLNLKTKQILRILCNHFVEYINEWMFYSDLNFKWKYRITTQLEQQQHKQQIMKTKVNRYIQVILTLSKETGAIIHTDKFSRRWWWILSVNEYCWADYCKQSDNQGVHLGMLSQALNNVNCCLHLTVSKTKLTTISDVIQFIGWTEADQDVKSYMHICV